MLGGRFQPALQIVIRRVAEPRPRVVDAAKTPAHILLEKVVIGIQHHRPLRSFDFAKATSASNLLCPSTRRPAALIRAASEGP